ncbi:hypothetical protein QWJ26_08820 [Streptomyces sp. CSDS2]|uniref:hypothetical protein n=1 Tax=Streptomyces sp. CSDS2 TaxID=3055051 RepID=UPI0025B1B371|nr:hypothetical protein [Streptomyces sp. CSDS2]MDN3259904.1 hypothetical protein [Streptomyces sp. CSDS2]
MKLNLHTAAATAALTAILALAPTAHAMPAYPPPTGCAEGLLCVYAKPLFKDWITSIRPVDVPNAYGLSGRSMFNATNECARLYKLPDYKGGYYTVQAHAGSGFIPYLVGSIQFGSCSK